MASRQRIKPAPPSTGRVELAAGHDSPERPPFLWDTASMPSRATSCAHCDPNQKPPLCCGVCVFEGRRCDAYYPQEGRAEAVAQHLLDSGYRLKVGCNHGWVGGTRMACRGVGQLLLSHPFANVYRTICRQQPRGCFQLLKRDALPFLPLPAGPVPL